MLNLIKHHVYCKYNSRIKEINYYLNDHLTNNTNTKVKDKLF